MLRTAGDLFLVIGPRPASALVVSHLGDTAAGRLVDDAVRLSGAGMLASVYRPPAGDLLAWHRDLWWALPRTSRENVVLAAGPTAAFLPTDAGHRVLVVGPPELPAGVNRRRLAELVAGEGRRRQRKLAASANPHARLVWLEADEDIPLSDGIPEPAERWRSWADEIAARTELLTPDGLDPLAGSLSRALEVAGGSPTAQPSRRRSPSDLEDALGRLNWLDGLLRERADQAAAGARPR